jgi:DNA-binding transcriptional MerR regulator
MQTKTTRAFRTISEAGEELDLQPHVLRFWESKFSQIKPIKRGGGRRFYRPEDIEFLRGIKILLHDEGHPIKDVQKLIRLKGPGRVLELGQSVEKAAREKEVKDTVLIPERIRKPSKAKKTAPVVEPTEQIKVEASQPRQIVPPPVDIPTAPTAETARVETAQVTPDISAAEVEQRRGDLEEALLRLESLKSRWANFKTKPV